MKRGWVGRVCGAMGVSGWMWSGVGAGAVGVGEGGLIQTRMQVHRCTAGSPAVNPSQLRQSLRCRSLNAAHQVKRWRSLA